jgi:hypothetical protein
MAKRPKLSRKEPKAQWKAPADADRRFVSALGVIVEAIDDSTLRYCEPPVLLERTLREVDRDTLFSLVAECLCRLLNSSALERLRRKRRAARRRPTT